MSPPEGRSREPAPRRLRGSFLSPLSFSAKRKGAVGDKGWGGNLLRAKIRHHVSKREYSGPGSRQRPDAGVRGERRPLGERLRSGRGELHLAVLELRDLGRRNGGGGPPGVRDTRTGRRKRLTAPGCGPPGTLGFYWPQCLLPEGVEPQWAYRGTRSPSGTESNGLR